MMLLVATAISVAFITSLPTTLGLFGLEFWWERAALIVIMLLSHWLEMRRSVTPAGRSRRSPSRFPTRRSDCGATSSTPPLLRRFEIQPARA